MRGYLKFNDEILPSPDSYDINIDDVKEKYQTEAGTKQKVLVRNGVTKISVSFTLTSKWLKKMSQYRREKEINVSFYDPESDGQKTAVMSIEGYSTKLNKESERLENTNGIWDVSFTLEQY